MTFCSRLLALALILASLPASAGQPEARETARLNNCIPKKIEVFQNEIGSSSKVIYQVTCNLPKTSNKDAEKGGPDSLLIVCDQSLCDLMRPVSLDKK